MESSSPPRGEQSSVPATTASRSARGPAPPSSLTTPSVYIILVNRNRGQLTLECLESVFRLSYPNFRVILVDNGSSDDSAARFRDWAEGRDEPPSPLPTHGWIFARPLHRPDRHAILTAEMLPGEIGPTDAPLVVVLAGRNLGFPGANNLAIELAQARGDADFFWLLNNDTLVAPDALDELVRSAEVNSKVGVVGSKVLFHDRPETVELAAGGRFLPWCAQSRHSGANLPAAAADATGKLDYVCGASMLIRSTLLDSVGRLEDSYFLYGEDVDFCLRATRAGWKLAYAPRSRVWHVGGATTPHKSPVQDYYAVRNSLALVRRFHPSLLPAALACTVARSVLPKLLRSEWPRLVATVGGLRDACTGRRGELRRWDAGGS